MNIDRCFVEPQTVGLSRSALSALIVSSCPVSQDRCHLHHFLSHPFHWRFQGMNLLVVSACKVCTTTAKQRPLHWESKRWLSRVAAWVLSKDNILPIIQLLNFPSYCRRPVGALCHRCQSIWAISWPSSFVASRATFARIGIVAESTGCDGQEVNQLMSLMWANQLFLIKNTSGEDYALISSWAPEFGKESRPIIGVGE